MEQFLLELSVLVLPMILAVTLHEAAHAFVAWRLGDDTAYRAGRVTFNPLSHVDPLGTVILPMLMYFSTNFLFGWAKPVPVNVGRLGHPKRDMVWVALAGPGINLALALLSELLIRGVPLLPSWAQDWAFLNLRISVDINVMLAVFNMLPLPPLDGGRVAVGVLPLALAQRLAALEPYGMLVLLGLLFVLPAIGTQIDVDLNPISRLLGPVIATLTHGLDSLVGPF